MTLDPNAAPGQGNTDSGVADGNGGVGDVPSQTPAPAGGDAPPATGTPPAADPAAPPAGHWSDGIEFLKGDESVKAYEKPEDMIAAHKAMKERLDAMGEPVTDAEKLKLEIPEGVDPSNPMFDWFKKKVTERGLGDKYAQNVLNDFVAYQAELSNQMHVHCMDVLKAQWGNDLNKELAVCNDTIGTFDKAVPGFGAWVTSNPSVGSDPVFVNFIHYLSKAIGEDSLPPGKGGASPSREMSTEDFLKTVVAPGSVVGE